MRLLSVFLRRSKHRLCLAIAAGVVSGLSTTALIFIVNVMIRHRGERMSIIVSAFAILCILRVCTGIGSHALFIRLSQDAIRDLRVEMCDRILGAPLRQLEQCGPSRFIASFSEDILVVGTAVVNLPYVFVNVVILGGCFLYLGWLSPKALFEIAPCITLGGATYLVAIRRANRWLGLARQEQDRLLGHFRDLVTGIKQLKLHAGRRMAFMENSVIVAADQVRDGNTAGITVYSAAANWSRLLFFVYVGLLLFVPSGRPGTGQLAASVIVILYMMAPLEAILNALPLLAQADVAMNKIESLQAGLGCEHAAGVPMAGLESVQQWRELALSDIRYTYESRPGVRSFTVGPIDLALRPGEITFIVGGNGSGKTTLGKLIAGLYPPDSGEVRFDGEPLSNLGHTQMRGMFSAVFDDGCLFDPGLGIDPERIKEASRYLRSLNLDHKVAMSSGRFSTTELSSGQRKRLALLIVLLEDRPVCLLDEWAADQEPEFKEMFYHQIVPDMALRGKAVVVITHDDRYFHIADQVLRLDKGLARASAAKVAEHGSAFLQAIKTRERLDAKVV